MGKKKSLTKAQNRLYKCIKKDNDWDWVYLMTLEKEKLINMANYFSKSRLVVGWENDVKWINYCIKLINIIIEDDFPDNKVGVHKINFKNVKRFYNRHELTNNDMEDSYIKNMIYTLKAENLYYEIRKNYTRNWWD